MATTIDSMNPDLSAKLAKIVASCWLDAEYKSQVLDSPTQTFADAGIDLPTTVTLVVVEDDVDRRNVVLADRPLPPHNQVTELKALPDFYSVYSYVYTRSIADPDFKQDFLGDPAGTFRSLGAQLPDDITIEVHQDTDTERFFTLPMTPRSRVVIELNERNLSVLDAANVNVNIDANVQANVNADVNVNAGLQVNGAAVATVVVAVAVLI